METIIIYHNEKIKSIDDIRNITSICYDPPEARCECNRCFKYEVSIQEIEEISKEKYNQPLD